jgi:hypothetical protein
MSGRSIRVYGLFIIVAVFTTPYANLVNAQPDDAASLKSTALAFAPRDAAFFVTSLNLRTAWNGFLSGNFVTRLRNLPYVQRLEGEVLTQWAHPEGQVRTLKDYLKTPTAKSLLELLVDMNSQEIFCYGARDWNESIGGWAGLYQDLNSRSNNPLAMQEFLTKLDAEYLSGVKVPTTVVGFRLNNEELARTLLDAFQGALQIGMQQIPELVPLSKQITRKDGQAESSNERGTRRID